MTTTTEKPTPEAARTALLAEGLRESPWPIDGHAVTRSSDPEAARTFYREHYGRDANVFWLGSTLILAHEDAAVRDEPAPVEDEIAAAFTEWCRSSEIPKPGEGSMLWLAFGAGWTGHIEKTVQEEAEYQALSCSCADEAVV